MGLALALSFVISKQSNNVQAHHSLSVQTLKPTMKAYAR